MTCKFSQNTDMESGGDNVGVSFEWFSVSASQTWIVLSQEPETMDFPSGENATEVTQAVCPVIGSEMSSPVSTSQTRNVSSAEPDKMCFPSEEKATEVTLLVCPERL